jgi:hypothetical protein
MPLIVFMLALIVVAAAILDFLSSMSFNDLTIAFTAFLRVLFCLEVIPLATIRSYNFLSLPLIILLFSVANANSNISALGILIGLTAPVAETSGAGVGAMTI